MPCVVPKSCPVPAGSTASSASSPATPFTTSFSVPSPPTTTSSSCAGGFARRARPGGRAAREQVARRRGRARRARRSSFGQRLPVEPFALAGLTRKNRSSAHAAQCFSETATSSASRVIRSTAARSSSSLMRVNSPSTTMSLTVSRQPASTPRSARDREQRCRLHLDAEHAALRPALVLALVRVVEEVARDDRPDVELRAAVLRDVHGLVDEAPRRGRAVRLVVRRGASRSSRRARR